MIRLGELLGQRYEVRARRGRGMFSGVDRLLRREVAIRILEVDNPAVLQNRNPLDQFQLILSKHHPNILDVYDIGQEDYLVYIVTPLAKQGSLTDYLHGRGPLSLEETAQILQPIAGAIETGHSLGIAHARLEPDKILVFNRDPLQLVVSDFGLAKFIAQSQVERNTLSGNLAYMSPEQITNNNPGRSSDVYALGIMLYQMLAGELPYQGDAFSLLNAHLHSPIPLLDQKRSGVGRVSQTVAKAMAKDPAERPKIGALYEAFRRAVPQLDLPAPAMPRIVATPVEEPDFIGDDVTRPLTLDKIPLPNFGPPPSAIVTPPPVSSAAASKEEAPLTKEPRPVEPPRSYRAAPTARFEPKPIPTGPSVPPTDDFEPAYYQDEEEPVKGSKSVWRVLGPVLVLVVLAVLGGATAFLVITSGQNNTLQTAEQRATATQAAYDGSNARETLLARRGEATTPPANAVQPVTTAAPAPTAAPVASPTPAAPTATPTPTGPLDIQQANRQLDEAWNSYKQNFIQGDGRVIDPVQDGLTTSEGQSYAMLRAVWQNDRETFDKALDWTQRNLQIRGDKLFAYRWGKAGDGTYKLLDEGNATDADVDIMLALVFATQKWGDSKYQRLALEISDSLWSKSILTLRGKPYLLAGSWGIGQEIPALNPSYLSPYAFRIFKLIDPSRNWDALIDTSYEIIRACSEVELGGVQSVKLPANWCGINKQNSRFTTAQDYPNLNTNYGYDAFRTMWRVALDYKWFGEKRALDYLTYSDFLRNKYKQEGRLVAEYSYGGAVVEPNENLATYGGNLGNFMVADPDLAKALVNNKILPSFRREGNRSGWGYDLYNYYSQNWAWFGLALYADRLPNLAANFKPTATTAPVTTSSPTTTGAQPGPNNSPRPTGSVGANPNALIPTRLTPLPTPKN